MMIHQVLRRTYPVESRVMQHLSPGPFHHRTKIALDVPGYTPGPTYPGHVSDASAVSWSVSESGPADQVSAGTAGSRKDTGHRESRPSTAQNLNTGAAEGYAVGPDVAAAAVVQVVVAILLLPLLPGGLSLLS
ncbi:hypothetical protein A2U01_0023689 [Trifolium medium]|uniref:Uncharacterized protein n=1 Tax=Trifolium medium TaxID=97028 RepID=A0A392NVY7_9FABA|nr:hypothetical protein [Trifolium medium]